MNWLIHLHYVRQDFDECLKIVEEQLEATKGKSEYALFVKALVKRNQGCIEESLLLFQQVANLAPLNLNNLKQVARSLFLLGKHKAALDVYSEAAKIEREDWEIWHNKGMCYKLMRDYEKAMKCFRKANAIQRHDVTYLQLGKVYALLNDFKQAIEVLTEALEFSPESPDLLTTVGVLSLRTGETRKAFAYLGNAMTHDPKNPGIILATASVMQDHGSIDEALIKYRIAAVKEPNSGQLWNNIGMCFFMKKKFVASIACLKRALYLMPFEWLITYNLGLVHLVTGQYASAFHFFSATINLNSALAMAYMYLAVTLSRLQDTDNSSAAFNKAIELDCKQPLFYLNYAITLLNAGQVPRAKAEFRQFEKLYQSLSEEQKQADPDIVQQRLNMIGLLGNPS